MGIGIFYAQKYSKIPFYPPYYKTQKIELKEELVDKYLDLSSSDKLKQKLNLTGTSSLLNDITSYNNTYCVECKGYCELGHPLG